MSKELCRFLHSWLHKWWWDCLAAITAGCKIELFTFHTYYYKAQLFAPLVVNNAEETLPTTANSCHPWPQAPFMSICKPNPLTFKIVSYTSEITVCCTLQYTLRKGSESFWFCFSCEECSVISFQVRNHAHMNSIWW